MSRQTKYLTVPEVADLCRTTPATVRYWRHVGRGPRSFKLGRRVLYAVDDVEAWIDGARNADAKEPETWTVLGTVQP